MFPSVLITDIIQNVENPRFRHCMETSKFSRKKAFQIEVKEATRAVHIYKRCYIIIVYRLNVLVYFIPWFQNYIFRFFKCLIYILSNEFI
jgi:hypothetical protein